MRRLIAVLLAVLVLAGCVSRSGPPAADDPDPPETATEESTGESAEDPEGCSFEASPGADTPVGLPPAEPVGGDLAVLKTSSGDLAVALTPDEAPCTVRSFLHLAGEGFFDGTQCHRLTTSAGLKVLQCGDPKGDGTGGPGYTIPDELPTDLADAPGGTSGQPLNVYPRGTVAMANAGPGTGGSQFFLVYGDSTIPPSYTVFGSVDQTALTILDSIAARGLTPVNGPEDGTPRQTVRINTVTTG